MRKKILRPSGLWAMPLEIKSCAATPCISSPAKTILPLRGGRMPWMERSVVVLPAPLEPMRVTTSPSSTVSEIPRRAWMCP